jgi:hypothetical protein
MDPAGSVSGTLVACGKKMRNYPYLFQVPMWNSTNISSSFSAPQNHSLDSLLFKEIIGRRSIHVFLQYRISWSYLFYNSGMLFNTKLIATVPVTTIVSSCV